MQEIRCVNNKWLNDEKWLKESGIVISDRRRHNKKTTEERKSRLKGWLIINDDKEVVQRNVFFSSKLCHGWNVKYPPKDLVLEDLFPDCGLVLKVQEVLEIGDLMVILLEVLNYCLLFLSSLIVSVTVFWL